MRNIRLYTGAGGMDVFEEAMQEQVGLKRIYLGKKVLRILRKTKTPIMKSAYTGRWYKLMGLKKSIEEFKYTFISL